MIRHMELWLGAYLRQALRPAPRPPSGRPLTIYLAVGDHFEPFWGGPALDQAESRMKAWEEGLAPTVAGLFDAEGRLPQHTFFYPIEDYRPDFLDRLAAMRGQGLGDVEVHLHHHGESSAQLEDMLAGYAALRAVMTNNWEQDHDRDMYKQMCRCLL